MTLPMSLSIGSCAIRQDADARFCLNDLHQAAGGEKRHQPSNWLQADQTKALIAEIEKSTPGIPGVRPTQAVAKREGAGGGTYVVKELVYGYAMWISPAFNLQVIRAFDALHQPAAPSDINSIARWNAVHTGNRWVLFEIPNDAAILPRHAWPDAIRDKDFPSDLLPDVLTAVSERMKGLTMPILPPPTGVDHAEDSWVGKIAPWIKSKDKTTVSEVLSDCLGIDIGKQTRSHQTSAGNALRRLGWTAKQEFVASVGKRVRVYRRRGAA